MKSYQGKVSMIIFKIYLPKRQLKSYVHPKLHCYRQEWIKWILYEKVYIYIIYKESNNSIKSPRDKSNQGEKTIQEKKRKELKTASVPHNIIKIITKRISCYYSMTKTGFAHDKPKKFNQDNYFIHKNLCDNENSYFFGVW